MGSAAPWTEKKSFPFYCVFDYDIKSWHLSRYTSLKAWNTTFKHWKYWYLIHTGHHLLYMVTWRPKHGFWVYLRDSFEKLVETLYTIFSWQALEKSYTKNCNFDSVMKIDACHFGILWNFLVFIIWCFFLGTFSVFSPVIELPFEFYLQKIDLIFYFLILQKPPEIELQTTESTQGVILLP